MQSPTAARLVGMEEDSDEDLPVHHHSESDPIRVNKTRTSRDEGDEAAGASAEEDESNEDDDSDKEQANGHTRVASTSKVYSEEEEKAIIRKFDRRLVLFMALLYMLSFLDRSNIGNARIAGLDESLNLSSSQYSWLLTSFYIAYIAFQWMVMLFGIVSPHVYIAACVLVWGLLASLQSVATSFVALAILRGLLGVAEAAFGPGVPFYLTFFYRRSELAYRVGLFIAAAPLATSFASSLAWVIVKVTQNGPIEPWRALFLVEGFPSVIAAFFAFRIVPDSPFTTRYLTSREKKVAKLRLQAESASVTGDDHRDMHLSAIFKTFLDPKAYLTALMFFSANVSFSSLPVFLPTILKDMSFSPLASQALAAPPYLCAFVFVLVIAHYSDKIPDSRSWFISGVALISSASYGTIALAGMLHESIGVSGTLTIRYIGVYGAAMGFFAAITLIITWTLNNQHSASGKGAGLTILQVIGQMGPLLGVQLFPKSQGPYYVPGMAICAGFMLFVAILALALRWDLARKNKSQTVAEYEMVDGAGAGLMGIGGRLAWKEQFRFML